MLASQLATLEPPEDAITVAASDSPAKIVTQVIGVLEERGVRTS